MWVKHPLHSLEGTREVEQVASERSLKARIDAQCNQRCGYPSQEKEMLEIKTNKTKSKQKNSITKVKNAFVVLIGRLDTAKERLSEPEDISVEISKHEEQREQTDKGKKRGTIQEIWFNCESCNIHITGVPEGEEKKGTEEMFETIRTGHFSKWQTPNHRFWNLREHRA